MNSKFLSVYILTVVNGLSMMMFFPLLPVIVSNYQVSALVLGGLVATYSFFQMIGAPLLGSLSDLYGRKPILIITQAGTFMSWILLATGFIIPVSSTLWGFSLPLCIIFLARIIDGITGGNNSVAQAMVADMTTQEERAIVFGKTGAVMGGTLIVGPVLGALAMSTSIGMLGTAILGGVTSFIALLYMVFSLQESLTEKKESLEVSFQNINVFSQIKKWKKIPMIKMMIILKIFFFMGFTIYTTLGGLYLIDFFGFKPENVGFYLAFTGSFLIFHQIFSLKYLLAKYDKMTIFLLGQGIMFLSFYIMGFIDILWLFTCFYFFAVLGISISFNTLQALISTAVDQKSQGEVMGMTNGIESFLMIIAPLFGSWAYGYFYNDISIYSIISFFPLFGLGIYYIYFRKRK